MSAARPPIDQPGNFSSAHESTARSPDNMAGLPGASPDHRAVGAAGGSASWHSISLAASAPAPADVEAVAEASGASLYTVDQPADLRWHVPSRAVDPGGAPALAAWLSHVDVAIAVHGYGRTSRPRHLLVGGTNRVLAALVADSLSPRLRGFEIISEMDAIPAELRGLHPKNPVNRPAAGGVQLELPPAAGASRAAARPGVGSRGRRGSRHRGARRGGAWWRMPSRPGRPGGAVPGLRRGCGRRGHRRGQPVALDDRAIGGTAVTLQDVIDDQFLARYRALLDAEDAAFDGLEPRSDGVELISTWTSPLGAGPSRRSSTTCIVSASCSPLR